ncbi:MAG: hypothetical protein HXY34_14110 [Candidatus Thorarchaeota archaeon]|nr:hypothetical protein [Candidatus Thorarchaeota archaeon]
MEKRIKTKPNLSVLALISFIASFAVARVFTSINPTAFWQVSGYHIHHFWYGLAMIAIGGWLGITVESERINRVAAILFGAGGGLIGDEFGLLLELKSESYWADITYTLIIMFVALASTIILLIRYSKTMLTEFTEFIKSNASLYFGVFLEAISIAFILETDNLLIIVFFSSLAIVACAIIVGYFIQRIIRRWRLQIA